MNKSAQKKSPSTSDQKQGFQGKGGRKAMKAKTDIYQSVTDAIITAIEGGAKGTDFVLPWHGVSALPQNASTKKLYRGVNVPMLWASQMNKGYGSALWATYKQWSELGAQVRKGEKSTTIVFWKIINTEPSADNEDQEKRMFARWSNVFNVAQVDGWEPEAPAEPAQIDPHAAADALVLASGANIEHGDFGACYIPSRDLVRMPRRESFKETGSSSATENYYSTLLHEINHWAGAKHRLDRKDHKKYGDSDYAFEELIAELGSAMLCASTGVESTVREDHAQYIENWLRALKGDKHFIFAASSQAQKAADYLHALQDKAEAE